MTRGESGESAGVGVLVGAAVVVILALGLVLMAGDFGHTRRMNENLAAPHLSAPAAPGFK